MEKLEELTVPLAIKILSGDPEGEKKLDAALSKAASSGEATVFHNGYEITIKRAFRSVIENVKREGGTGTTNRER